MERVITVISEGGAVTSAHPIVQRNFSVGVVTSACAFKGDFCVYAKRTVISRAGSFLEQV